MKELSRLGFPRPTNQMAPLARLLAIGTFVRHSSAHAHLLPVMASVAASLALRRSASLRNGSAAGGDASG